jgi:TIR domain
MFTSVFASLDAKRPIHRSATPDSWEVCLHEMSYTASLSGRFGTSFYWHSRSAIYSYPWSPELLRSQNVAERQRLKLYVACIRAAAIVEPEATRIQPYAAPEAVKKTQCAKSVGWCRSANKNAVTTTAPALPVVRAKTGSRHPLKNDSSRTGPSETPRSSNSARVPARQRPVTRRFRSRTLKRRLTTSHWHLNLAGAYRRRSGPHCMHDVFISYSRKDIEFARRLEKALRNYEPPKGLKLPSRNLNVFRDEEDFTGAEYFTSLDRHLRESSKFIVICSPHARASPYVNDEIQRFARLHGPENILSVLVAGIPNNEAVAGQGGKLKMSARDAARVLGISHQRVHQLAHDPSR